MGLTIADRHSDSGTVRHPKNMKLLKYVKKVRFRNHTSTLPQPNFDTSAIKIRHASETKKRFCNQKRAMPQPKKDVSTTKKGGFCNQPPRILETKTRVPLQPRSVLSGTKRRCRCRRVRLGGDTSVLAAFPLTPLQPHSPWNLLLGWGGGLGGDTSVLAAFPLKPLRPRSPWHPLAGVGWGGDMQLTSYVMPRYCSFSCVAKQNTVNDT